MAKQKILIGIILAVFSSLIFTPFITAETIRVTVPSAHVRSGPGTDYQSLATVSSGTSFNIVSMKRGWYRIPLPDGREGWISGSVVTVEARGRGISVSSQSRFFNHKQFYGNSWAVVIGIDRYPHQKIPNLKYAVNDARSVAEAIVDQGFSAQKTFVLLNEKATKDSIEEVLYSRLRSAGNEDRVLIFFAGHGETERLPRGGSEGFLLPYDAAPDNLFLTAISMADVKKMGQRIAAKHILFVVDACYSGFTITRAVAPRIVDEHYLSLVTKDPAVQVITAGKAKEQVGEELGHGIFTTQFLKGLKGFADEDQNGLITAMELASFLQSRVIRETSGGQHPQFGQLSGEGQFVFVIARSGGATVETFVGREEEATLRIRANVEGARLYLNGVDKGVVPLNLYDVEPGRYEVKVTKAGYEPYAEKVLLSPGKELEILAYLEKVIKTGNISVTGIPHGAKVYLDGYYAGQLPYTLKEVETGLHTLTVTSEGYQNWEKKVKLQSGQELSVTARLTPLEKAETTTALAPGIGIGASSLNPWPKYQCDAQNTGRSRYSGPSSRPSLRPIYNTEVGLSSSTQVIIGQDGKDILYFISDDEQKRRSNRCWALRPDGSLLWSKVSMGMAPAIGAEAVVYAMENYDDTIAAYDSTGKRLWSLYAGRYPHSMSIDYKGNLYVPVFGPNNQLLSLTNNGIPRWTKKNIVAPTGYGSPALSPDHSVVYFGTKDHTRASGGGHFYGLYTQNGREKWKRWFKERPGVPSIAVDGTVYVPLWPIDGGSWRKGSGTYLYALGPGDGAVKWTFAADSVVTTPAIGSDGTLFTASVAGTLFAIDPTDGRLKWRHSLGESALVYQPPSVDAGGTVYVTTRKKILALNQKKGTLLWTLDVPSDDIFVTTCSIGSDESLYLLARGLNRTGKVYVLR